MGYDDSLALKLSLNKKARNERRLCRFQAKGGKNIEVSIESKKEPDPVKIEKLLTSINNSNAYRILRYGLCHNDDN